MSNALTRHQACPRGHASSEVSRLHQDTGIAASRNDETSLSALSAALYRGVGTQEVYVSQTSPGNGKWNDSVRDEEARLLCILFPLLIGRMEWRHETAWEGQSRRSIPS